MSRSRKSGQCPRIYLRTGTRFIFNNIHTLLSELIYLCPKPSRSVDQTLSQGPVYLRLIFSVDLRSTELDPGERSFLPSIIILNHYEMEGTLEEFKVHDRTGPGGNPQEGIEFKMFYPGNSRWRESPFQRRQATLEFSLQKQDHCLPVEEVAYKVTDLEYEGLADRTTEKSHSCRKELKCGRLEALSRESR